MTEALREGTANIPDSEALRMLLKQLAPGLPFTRRAVQAWFNENVSFAITGDNLTGGNHGRAAASR
jgi:hypothetical protein